MKNLLNWMQENPGKTVIAIAFANVITFVGATLFVGLVAKWALN